MNINIEEEVYNEQFNKTYNFLKNSLTGDMEKDIKTLEKTIETLVISQGNDWTGRGELAQAKQSATISAAEVLKIELEEKKNHD